jgi:tRNA ligase
MREAIDFAVHHEVTSKHDLSFGKPAHAEKSPKPKIPAPPKPEKVFTADQLIGKLEYFSLPVSLTNINSILASLFEQAGAEEARVYRMLKQSRRIQGEFHVTLMHRASSTQHPDMWQMYTSEYRKAIVNKNLADPSQLNPSLGPARVKLERVVWDERIMAIVVRIYPSEGGIAWPSANSIPHITIGTASPDVKPVESNQLLAHWEAGEGAVHEKEIPGGIVLDGNVKPVFQRNAFGK